MVHDLNKESFEQAQKEHTILFLDFYAVWCGPCVQFSPIFHKVASLYEDKAFFGTVNVDNARDLAVNFRVASIPTLICVKNGVVVWSQTGGMSEASFTDKVASLL